MKDGRDPNSHPSYLIHVRKIKSDHFPRASSGEGHRCGYTVPLQGMPLLHEGETKPSRAFCPSVNMDTPRTRAGWLHSLFIVLTASRLPWDY